MINFRCLILPHRNQYWVNKYDNVVNKQSTFAGAKYVIDVIYLSSRRDILKPLIRPASPKNERETINIEREEEKSNVDRTLLGNC